MKLMTLSLPAGYITGVCNDLIPFMKLMTLSLPAGYITGVCNDLIPLFDENATLQLIYTKKTTNEAI